jgi:Phage major capsid protein E
VDLVALIRELIANGLIDDLATNPQAQFGLAPEVFFGASLLPEQTVEGNTIEDESLRYRSIIANDAARYSPVQLKEGAAMFGSMFARLAESDIGKEFTAQQYDNVRRLLNRGGTMQAQAAFLGWLDQEVNQALLRKNELYRWQAIIDAAIIRLGDNNYSETVTYDNPVGNRRTVLSDWTNDNNDPMTDIFGLVQDAQLQGIVFGRVVMSTKTAYTLAQNDKIQNRAGNFAVMPDGTLIRNLPRVPTDVIGAFLSAGLPSPEIYDGVYYDSTGAHRYMHEDKIVFFGQTGRTVTIEPEVGDPFFLENTVGYLGVGTTGGADNPGRVINVIVEDQRKPPRVDVEAWQTSLPVIQSPEHIWVLDVTL